MFHLGSDDDQEKLLKKEPKRVVESNESSAVQKELFADDIDVDPIYGDENESGKFPFIFWPILITNP